MREVEEKEEKLDIEVALLAYKKIVYHLIRYPTHKVTGTPLLTQEHSLALNPQKSPTHTPFSTPPSSTPPSASLWISSSPISPRDNAS